MEFKTYLLDDVEICTNLDLSEDFVKSEIEDLESTHNRSVQKITFTDLGNGTCNESVEWCPIGFERIRRITGYLVGTLDRFNDAKRAEEADRVFHS